MFEYLYHLSDNMLFFSLTTGSILISLLAILAVKKFVPLHVRYRDDPVIGNTSNLISLIYGVLAGLTALFLINNITFISNAVQEEANASADLYRNSKWLAEPVRSNIKNHVRSYLQEVITVDWPLMKEGKDITSEGENIIDYITNELIHYSGTTRSENLLLTSMMEEVRSLNDARQLRINMSYSALSPEVWIVILIGTFLTLFINYLFGMNFYLHIITVIAAALMTSSMIFLLFTLDRPFRGEFAIEPDSFRRILMRIDKETELAKSNKQFPQQIYSHNAIDGLKK